MIGSLDEVNLAPRRRRPILLLLRVLGREGVDVVAEIGAGNSLVCGTMDEEWRRVGWVARYVVGNGVRGEGFDRGGRDAGRDLFASDSGLDGDGGTSDSWPASTLWRAQTHLPFEVAPVLELLGIHLISIVYAVHVPAPAQTDPKWWGSSTPYPSLSSSLNVLLLLSVCNGRRLITPSLAHPLPPNQAPPRMANDNIDLVAVLVLHIFNDSVDVSAVLVEASHVPFLALQQRRLGIAAEVEAQRVNGKLSG